MFKLSPGEDGWEIEVFQAGRDENLDAISRATSRMPPHRNYINAAAVKDRDTKNFSREWSFSFTLSSKETTLHGQMDRAEQPLDASRDITEGRGYLKITDIKFKKRDKKPFISEMSFDVIVHQMSLPLIDGQVPLHVTRDVTPPKAIYTPDPAYSEEARQAKYQGTVVLWTVIGKDGQVKRIVVTRRLGKGLDEAAVAAVRTWTFEPALRNGEPVPVQADVEVNFRLYR